MVGYMIHFMSSSGNLWMVMFTRARSRVCLHYWVQFLWWGQSSHWFWSSRDESSKIIAAMYRTDTSGISHFWDKKIARAAIRAQENIRLNGHISSKLKSPTRAICAATTIIPATTTIHVTLNSLRRNRHMMRVCI